MKKRAETVAVVDVPNEGLIKYLGKRVLFVCMRYNYIGTLNGVNDDCVELTEALMVFDTGSISDNKISSCAKIPGGSLILMKSSIESFIETSKTA